MNKNQAIEYLVTKIHDEDEPLFILRGRDVCAPSAISAWVHAAKVSGVNHEKLDGALTVGLAMCRYEKKKFPD